MISFIVYGKAKPAGALAIGKRKDGGRFLHHRESAALRDFKASVRAPAGEALGTRDPFAGAVRLEARFYFTRPGAHFGTGRNAGALKASAPEYPSNRGQADADKLARGLLDALTGILFLDDSQVADLVVRKRWAHGPARIEVDVDAMTEAVVAAD